MDMAASWPGSGALSRGSRAAGVPSPVTAAPFSPHRGRHCLEALEDLLEETGGGDGGVGLCAETVHDLHVVVDVPSFILVEGAGQVLQVDDVGEVGRGEAQHGEGASGGGVTPAAERHDLEGD